MRKIWRLSVLGLLASALFVACGGDEFTASGSAGQSGSGGSAGTGGSAGGAGGTGATGGGDAGAVDASTADSGVADSAAVDASDGGALSLEMYCSAAAASYCLSAQPCCSNLFSYDLEGCKAVYLQACAKEAQAVVATTKSYHPEHAAACQASLERLLVACTPSARQFLEEFDGLRACAMVFQGKKLEGEYCAATSDCQPSTNPNIHIGCGGLFQVFGLGTCQRTTALPQASECQVGGAASPLQLCRAGLYCDIQGVTGGSGPFYGRCEPALGVEDICKPLGGFDVQCGLGAYCFEERCQPSQPGGAACDGKNERCLSNDCKFFGNTCQPPVQMVTAQACGGDPAN